MEIDSDGRMPAKERGGERAAERDGDEGVAATRTSPR
jgi:hypothetical protein